MAGLLYASKGFIPESRQYLRKPLQRALDLIVVDEMLKSTKQRDALQYFRGEIVPEETKQDEALADAHERLGHLSELGFLGRILVPELIDYPSATRFAAPRSHHFKETTRFIDYLYSLTGSIYLEYVLETPASDAALDFQDTHIKVSFVIVGKSELMEQRGFEPYLRRVGMCRSSGARAIYMVGGGRNARAVEEIAHLAKTRGLIDDHKLQQYEIMSGVGPLRYCFGRLVVKEPAQ